MKIELELQGVTGGLDPDIATIALRDAIPTIVDLALTEARKNLSAYSKTGKTLAKLTSRLSLGGDNPEGEVLVAGKRSFIARLLETGTRPHPIQARRAPLLHFRTSGRWVTALMVQHPGFAGRHWLERAAATITPEAEQEVADAVERAANQQLARQS